MQENIKLAENLMASVLDEKIFTENKGVIKEWDEILSIYNGKNQKAVVNECGKYPIYGSGGIMGYANDFICPEGTTIIGRKGSINNPIFVETKFWNVDTAFGLVANKNLNSKYLYYFCLGYNFLKHNKSTTLPSLTKTDLLKIKMKVPEIEEQEKQVANLDLLFSKINLSKEKYKTKLQHFNALKSSLLDSAFKGEL